MTHVAAGRTGGRRLGLRRALVTFGALLAALAGLVTAAVPAGAHAILESSTPADGAVLRAAPHAVHLHFSEEVAITLGSLRVVDSNGTRVDLGDVGHGGSGHDVQVTLRRDLPVGTYVVGWRVISADTHPVHGGFLFSVGSKTPVRSGVVSSLSTTPDATAWQTAGRLLRWLAYGGAFIAVGLVVFAAWIDDHPPTVFGRIVAAASSASVVALVVALATDAAAATGLGAGAVFRSGVLRQVLAGGTNWTIAAIGAAGLLCWYAWARIEAEGRVAGRAAAALATVVMAAGFAASGHSRSTDPEAVVLAADAIHVAAGAIWFGGLVGLAVALRQRTRSTPDAEGSTADPVALVAKFSRMATWALLAVVAAGLTLAWAEVRALRALTSTTYGWLLVGKLVDVGAVALVAGYNHLRLTPAVQARPNDRRRWALLRRTVGTEVAILVAVLALTSVLVDTVPARTSAGIGTVASRTATFGSGSVQLVVDPARRGSNAIHLYVLDQNGSPLDRLTNVRVDLSLPAAELGPIERKAFHAGPGHWQINSDDLTIAGSWQLTLLAQPDAFTELRATVSVPIQP